MVLTITSMVLREFRTKYGKSGMPEYIIGQEFKSALVARAGFSETEAEKYWVEHEHYFKSRNK
jgi:hypothetical protein